MSDRDNATSGYRRGNRQPPAGRWIPNPSGISLVVFIRWILPYSRSFCQRNHPVPHGPSRPFHLAGAGRRKKHFKSQIPNGDECTEVRGPAACVCKRKALPLPSLRFGPSFTFPPCPRPIPLPTPPCPTPTAISARSAACSCPRRSCRRCRSSTAAYARGARPIRLSSAELDDLLRDYAGRPTPLYFAERLTERPRRREDLPQARRPAPHRRAQDQQRPRPGAAGPAHGQEAASSPRPAPASTAWPPPPSAPRFGLECVIYMGAVDMERQALNVFRMRLLGAEVRAGDRRPGDAQGRRSTRPCATG